ncbi:hypothetical protein ACSBR2_034348 [Camellia fascicularis]
MQLMRQSVGHVLSYKMLSSPHLASPSAVQTPPTGVSASAAKNKGMDNYKQGKYVDAIKWLSWAVILLEKTCDGAASMEVLSSRASCYKEVGEYKKAVVDCTKRNYNVSLPHNKIPDALCQLAKKMAAPAMPGGEEFCPEAAIVNYFGLAFFYCEVDGSSLCLQCNMIVHVGGKRTHERNLVLRQRIEFPGDKHGRMEDPTENRRGESATRIDDGREPAESQGSRVSYECQCRWACQHEDKYDGFEYAATLDT